MWCKVADQMVAKQNGTEWIGLEHALFVDKQQPNKIKQLQANKHDHNAREIRYDCHSNVISVWCCYWIAVAFNAARLMPIRECIFIYRVAWKNMCFFRNFQIFLWARNWAFEWCRSAIPNKIDQIWSNQRFWIDQFLHHKLTVSFAICTENTFQFSKNHFKQNRLAQLEHSCWWR